MNAPLTPEELRELLGAYALDAVDPDEAALVEELLRTDPRAREEVDRHREVAALLGASGGGAAPDGVWESIASEIGSGALPPVPTGELARVLEHPERRRSWPTRVIAAAGAVAAAVAVVLGVQVVRLDDRVDRLDRDEEAATIEDAAQSRGLADPNVTRVALTPTSGSGPGAVVALAPDGQGYLLAGDLPALDEAQTYQLWAISDGTPVSAGVLGPDPGTVAFRIDGADILAVTIEQAPGAVAPTQDPLLAGEVS